MRPHPVILVHGRGGDVNEMTALRDALVADRRCVFGINYGRERPGGPNGLARLDASGAEIDAYVDRVRSETGAERVDLIGHSAGGGVVDNVIQRRGAGWKVRRVVFFGGLHHPYAHVGLPELVDASLFLPNLTATARRIIPGIDVQTVIRTALDVYTGATGGPLEGSVLGIDAETAASGFAADLFEPDYWVTLQGSLSEVDGVYLVPRGTRGLHTNDSARDVCYTNIVGAGDLITGTAAGFQDPASNVDNFVLPTPSDHVGILSDPLALAKMLRDLNTPCAPRDPASETPAGTPMSPDVPLVPDGGAPASDAAAPDLDAGVPAPPARPDAGRRFEDALRDGGSSDSAPDAGSSGVLLSSGCGCHVAAATSRAWGPLLALAWLWLRRRRR